MDCNRVNNVGGSKVSSSFLCMYYGSTVVAVMEMVKDRQQARMRATPTSRTGGGVGNCNQWDSNLPPVWPVSRSLPGGPVMVGLLDQNKNGHNSTTKLKPNFKDRLSQNPRFRSFYMSM